jgi:hypothetical protein
MWRVLVALLIAGAILRAAPAAAACLTLGADERLTTRCLFDRFLRASPREQAAIDPILQRIFARQGRTPGAVGRGTLEPFVQPLLTWSYNINGGNPDRVLDLGLPFRPDPPYRAAGLLAGVRAGATGRYVYRRGGYLDFTGHGSAEYAPRYDIGVLGYFARACAHNESGLAWTLDACLTMTEINRDLSRDQVAQAELVLGRMFGLGGGHHLRLFAGARNVSVDATSELSSAPDRPFGQLQYFAGFQAISDRYPFVAIEAGMNEPVKDRTVPLHSLTATVSDRVMGRPFAVTARYGYAAGETLTVFDPAQGFVPRERRDRELRIVISYNVWRSWYVQLGFRDVDSNFDFFDEAQPIVGLSIPTIRF